MRLHSFSFLSTSPLRHAAIWLFVITACLATPFPSLAQGGTNASSASALRKELGIQTNEILVRQNEQEFLQMLHLDNLIWIQEIKNRNQIPVLAEELSSFSMGQDRVVKLRIRMLMFLLNCMLEGRKVLLFDELVKEAAALHQTNLQVNLVLIYAAFSNFSEVSQLIENFWQLREAADILDREPKMMVSNKSRIQYYIGDAYYHLGDYANASKYIHLSLLRYSGNQLIPHLNLMGYLYRLNKVPDSSDLYFKRALTLARAQNDSAYMGIASGNLGENFYLRKQYEAAIPLLETDARIAMMQKDFGLASNAQLLLSKIYVRKGEKEKAGILLGQGRESALRSGQYKRLKLLYSTSLLYYILMGQDEKAITCQDSLQMVSDSLAFREASLLRINPELIFQDKKAREAAYLERIENDARIQKRNQLILALIAAIIMGALGFWILRLRSRLRMNRILMENQHLEGKVAGTDIALRSMADNLMESNRQLNQLKESKSELAGKELRTMAKITDAQWADFLALFEQAHPHFLKQIKARFPNLTPSEIRFVMLVRMQIKDAQMSEMLGVGPEAIRQNRYRIKRKIAVTEGENFDDMILSI